MKDADKEKPECDEQVVLCSAGLVCHEDLRFEDTEDDTTPGIVILEAVAEEDLLRRTKTCMFTPPRQHQSLHQNIAKVKTERTSLRDLSPNK